MGDKRSQSDRQPVLSDVLVGGDVWSMNASMINQRRATEAAIHLLQGGLIDDALRELCDLEASCARIKAGKGAESVSMLFRLHDELTTKPDLYPPSQYQDATQRVLHYLRWLQQDGSRMSLNHKLILGSALAQPISSVVRQEAEKLYVEIEGLGDKEVSNSGISTATTTTTTTSTATTTKMAVVNCQVLGGKSDFDAMLLNLEGHKRPARSVCFNGDASKLCSGSADKTVRVWDARNGAVLFVMEGHTDDVNSVCWHPSSSNTNTHKDLGGDHPMASLVASGSSDGRIIVWDTTMGSIVTAFEVGKVVWGVEYAPNGETLAAGLSDGSGNTHTLIYPLTHPLIPSHTRPHTVPHIPSHTLNYTLSHTINYNSRYFGCQHRRIDQVSAG